MKTCCKTVVACALILLVAFSVLRSTPSVSAAGLGQITGAIKLDGVAPKAKPIDMSKDPACAQVKSNAPAATESVVAGANGALANVVVYVSQGLTGNEAASSQKVSMDQRGCQYSPHVVAVNVGEHMSVTNSDKTSHNIHPDPKPGGGNTAWNKSQLPGSAPLDVTWASEEVAIPVKCNIHPWMRAFIAVVKGPYGVSDASGAYKLDVGPGTYTLTAWQETYGTQTAKVTVAAGKPATADFTFKAK